MSVPKDCDYRFLCRKNLFVPVETKADVQSMKEGKSRKARLGKHELSEGLQLREGGQIDVLFQQVRNSDGVGSMACLHERRYITPLLNGPYNSIQYVEIEGRNREGGFKRCKMYEQGRKEAARRALLWSAEALRSDFTIGLTIFMWNASISLSFMLLRSFEVIVFC